MIGAVVLLGLSACLTRGGTEASSSVGAIATAIPSSPQTQAKPALRRCAFAIFAALPERREAAAPAGAGTIPVWRLADAAAPEEWSDRVLERPPRPATSV